jgi:glycine cleavage system H lipoate-binding protein
MAFLLMVVIFAIPIALEYFVFSKRYPELGAGWPAAAGLRPLSPAAWQPVAAGVFLQPTYTWGSLGPLGDFYLGVHPMLLGLVGPPCELECRQPGEHIAAGDALVTIGRAGRHLTVRSPVAARVDRVNHKAIREAQSREANGHKGAWLYRVRPERLDQEATAWLTGAAAAEWTRRQYHELRAFLQDSVAESHLGVTMADGGELPAGILGELDQAVWSDLEQRFLSPAGMMTA